MRSSPLRDSENGFLCLLFPVLLQVFWLHLRSLFLTLRSTPVLFASVPPFASTRPPLSSKQAAQKNERHSSLENLLTKSYRILYTLCTRVHWLNFYDQSNYLHTCA